MLFFVALLDFILIFYRLFAVTLDLAFYVLSTRRTTIQQLAALDRKSACGNYATFLLSLIHI